MDSQKPVSNNSPNQSIPPPKPKINFTYQQNISAPKIQVQQQQMPYMQVQSNQFPSFTVNSLNNSNNLSEVENIINIPQNQDIQQIQQQDYFIPPDYGYGQNMNFYGYGNQSQKVINLLNQKQQDKDKKVVAVIVTFVSGSSYDNLFTTVQQKSQEGTKVLVYSCSSNSAQLIMKQLKGQNSQNDKAKEIVKYMKQLDHDCVVFNWQCSSGYGSETFPEGKDKFFDFVKYILDTGHMVMFSDFSLKALINQWDEAKLGPNPFKKVGETSSPFQLHFESKTLIQSPSAQLQIVGQMSQSGKCHVQAMGGTIVYSFDKSIKENAFYKAQILTIAQTDCPCHDQKYTLQINGKKGVAGHILLTYKSGGHLLTSMGHWIQLMKIDTSQKKLFEVAQKQYGAQFVQKMKYEYAQMGQNQQRAYISSNAVNFVQNQVPCSNMMSKAMYSKKG